MPCTLAGAMMEVFQTLCCSTALWERSSLTLKIRFCFSDDYFGQPDTFKHCVFLLWYAGEIPACHQILWWYHQCRSTSGMFIHCFFHFDHKHKLLYIASLLIIRFQIITVSLLLPFSNNLFLYTFLCIPLTAPRCTALRNSSHCNWTVSQRSWQHCTRNWFNRSKTRAS